jgi:hypothetical protein
MFHSIYWPWFVFEITLKIVANDLQNYG